MCWWLDDLVVLSKGLAFMNILRGVDLQIRTFAYTNLMMLANIEDAKLLRDATVIFANAPPTIRSFDDD